MFWFVSRNSPFLLIISSFAILSNSSRCTCNRNPHVTVEWNDFTVYFNAVIKTEQQQFVIVAGLQVFVE
jgi:hypothetical protein